MKNKAVENKSTSKNGTAASIVEKRNIRERTKTEKLTITAMLAAMAYILAAFGHVMGIPLVSGAGFLTFDPKDVIIAFSGFIFGPLSASAVAIVVSFVEMITFSSTGLWGFLMNVLSSCAFACTACAVYRIKRTRIMAAFSLLCGVAAMCAVMIPWNYFITPIYMKVPREVVAKMLIPTFLPFNLLKGSINAVIVFVIYKPLKKALRSAGIIDF